jgi:hypothetical protein
VLFVLLQGRRSVAFHCGKRDLEKLLEYPDNKLSELVQVTQLDWKLWVIPTLPEAPLHFPDTGVFAILVSKPPDTLEWIFAVPIDPTRTAVLMPNELTWEMIEPSVTDGRLATWSVGSSAFCKRIVVHPSYLQTHSNEEILMELKRQRKFVDDQLQLIKERNNLVLLRNEILSRLINPES